MASSQKRAFSTPAFSAERYPPRPSTASTPKPVAPISTLCCATSRFSSTVMPANRRMFWKVRATLAFAAIRWPGSFSSANRVPFTCISDSSPAVGR